MIVVSRSLNELHVLAIKLHVLVNELHVLVNELHMLVNELQVLAIEWQSCFFACHSMADTQMLVLGVSR